MEPEKVYLSTMMDLLKHSSSTDCISLFSDYYGIDAEKASEAIASGNINSFNEWKKTCVDCLCSFAKIQKLIEDMHEADSWKTAQVWFRENDQIVYFLKSMYDSFELIVSAYFVNGTGSIYLPYEEMVPFSRQHLGGLSDGLGCVESLYDDLCSLVFSNTEEDESNDFEEKAEQDEETEPLSSDVEVYLPMLDRVKLLLRVLKHYCDAISRTMYYGLTFLILQNSQYVENSIKTISKELFDTLLPWLEIGCIEELQIAEVGNSFVNSGNTKGENTTFLQITTATYNIGIDAYSIRFDTPHEGVEYYHLNVKTPDGLEYNPLSEEEYHRFIHELQNTSKEFKWENTFKNYNNVLFAINQKLKKNVDRSFREADKKCDRVLTHKRLFTDDISIDDVNGFVVLYKMMLPRNSCNLSIGKDGELREASFLYHEFIRDILYTFLCSLSMNSRANIIYSGILNDFKSRASRDWTEKDFEENEIEVMLVVEELQKAILR